MELSEAIRNRRSIRKYTEQPIEFDKLTQVLESGTCAPSAGNIQNWHFILVTEKPIIKELYEHCLRQEVVYHAQAAIVVCGRIDKAERMYGLRGKRLYTVQNCACAIQNMLLTAHELGLGACWIGAFDEDKITTMFEIPAIARPQAIITLGYPAENPESHRKDIEHFVGFNKYGFKIKDVHLFMRDYSVEWEKQIKKTGEASEKGFNRFKEKVKIWWKNGPKRKQKSVLEKKK